MKTAFTLVVIAAAALTGAAFTIRGNEQSDLAALESQLMRDVAASQTDADLFSAAQYPTAHAYFRGRADGSDLALERVQALEARLNGGAQQ